jgi:hypothetical protein
MKQTRFWLTNLTPFVYYFSMMSECCVVSAVGACSWALSTRTHLKIYIILARGARAAWWAQWQPVPAHSLRGSTLNKHYFSMMSACCVLSVVAACPRALSMRKRFKYILYIILAWWARAAWWAQWQPVPAPRLRGSAARTAHQAHQGPHCKNSQVIP